MSACDRLGPLLDAFHDGELRGLRHWRVQRHVGGCAACRETLAEIEPIGNWVREIAGAASTPDVWADVQRQLSATARTAPPARPRFRPLFAMPVLGAVAAAGIVAALTFAGPADWTGLFGSTPDPVVRSLNTHGRPVMVLSGPDDETIIWLMDDERIHAAEDSTSAWI
jgi:anti-sigma factor RsiW